jgi:hypothetical protein
MHLLHICLASQEVLFLRESCIQSAPRPGQPSGLAALHRPARDAKTCRKAVDHGAISFALRGALFCDSIRLGAVCWSRTVSAVAPPERNDQVDRGALQLGVGIGGVGEGRVVPYFGVLEAASKHSRAVVTMSSGMVSTTDGATSGYDLSSSVTGHQKRQELSYSPAPGV